MTLLNHVRVGPNNLPGFTGVYDADKFYVGGEVFFDHSRCAGSKYPNYGLPFSGINGPYRGSRSVIRQGLRVFSKTSVTSISTNIIYKTKMY